MTRRRAEYAQLTVVPYSRLLGRPSCPPQDAVGGPLYPDFDDLTWQRLSREGEPRDQAPVPTEPTAFLAGNWTWCGPVVPDFSHQYAEFMHRLPLLREDRREGLLFAAAPDDTGRLLERIPHYVLSGLAALGLGDEPTHLVREPTRVECLTVLEPGTELYAPSHDWYLAELLRTRPWPAHQPEGSWLFLSRAGLTRGHPLGESYLEELVRDAGGAVLRPEAASVDTVLGAVESVRHLLITDGGAAHQLELLGRLPDRVTMVARRGADSARDGTADPLAQRAAESFAMIDANDGYICLRDMQAASWDPHGMALTNLPRLLEALRSRGLPLAPSSVDRQMWAEAVRWDLDRYLETAQQHDADPGLPRRQAEVRARVQEWIDGWSRDPRVPE